MLTQAKQVGCWLVVWALVASTAGLQACAPWPGMATGGLAERHLTDWPELARLQQRYNAAAVAGADRFQAGKLDVAHLLLIRAQREDEGGLFEDSKLTLTKADSVITEIERDLSKLRASRRWHPRD